MNALLQVALVSESEVRRGNLKRVLESNGARVILDSEYKEFTLGSLDESAAEILLVDLDEEVQGNVDFLGNLLDSVRIPVLINDCEVPESGTWGRRLVYKLNSLVRSHGENIEVAVVVEPAPAPVVAINDKVVKAPVKFVRPVMADRAESIWILGASIGGPQAVKEFMQYLPDDLPIGMILAQHIGASFVELLANQLDKSSAAKVIAADEGAYVKRGQLVLARARSQLSFDKHGTIKFVPVDPKWPYSPSIDAVILEAVACYRGKTNVILFSGMGNDGLEGCRQVIDQGGMVWGQRQDTCVVASMIEAASRENMVSYIGTPEQLAKKLLAQLGRV